MGKNTKTVFLISIATLVFGLVWKGCQDKVDPDWDDMYLQLQKDYFSLDKSTDSLQVLWRSLHHDQTAADTPGHAYHIVATPYLPTMEFIKFKYFVQLLEGQGHVLLSSVSGGGTSTLVDRMSRFVASSDQNILYLRCAPKFDVEYFRQYIGDEQDGVWKNGKLLQFLNQCAGQPEEKFVFVADDFDKINPETFFGPELWEKFTDRGHEVRYGDKVIELPDNFFMILVTHAGIGERVKLNNEHFRRLGNPIYIDPSVPEMVCFLREEYGKRKQQLSKTSDSEEVESLKMQLASLEDTANVKRFVYSFYKINEYIGQNYGPHFRLGTWSNVRKLYGKNDYENLLQTFIQHVNSLQPDKPLLRSDLDKITFTIDTNGKLKGSNFIYSTAMKMEEMGFLTEFVVGLTFLILSALSSWYFFKKRQQFIKDYTDKTYGLIQQFEAGKLNYDDASKEFVMVKKEVDKLVLDKKVTYTEATFFYNFIEDKIKRIEMARAVNANFEDLVRVFMEDGVLSDTEYRKLLSFLEEIKHKLSLQDYHRFKEDVEELYRSNGGGGF